MTPIVMVLRGSNIRLNRHQIGDWLQANVGHGRYVYSFPYFEVIFLDEEDIVAFSLKFGIPLRSNLQRMIDESEC